MEMHRLFLAAATAALLLSPIPVEARGGGGGSSGGGHSTASAHSVAAPAAHAQSSARCGSCSRDSHGHIARSEAAKQSFERETGYPHGRPGYVVDHVTPLKRGGADTPGNMQWQTKADAKAKDVWE